VRRVVRRRIFFGKLQLCSLIKNGKTKRNGGMETSSLARPMLARRSVRGVGSLFAFGSSSPQPLPPAQPLPHRAFAFVNAHPAFHDMDVPKVTPAGAGPIKHVRGAPVQGVAEADSEEKSAGFVAVSGKDGDLALRGYDCVSYRAPGATAPLPGDPAVEVFTENVVQGRVRYRFATSENADVFRRSHLSAHAPAFGGHCALAASRETLVPGDPLAFEIDASDGRLYLFCCDAAKRAWGKDRDALRAKACDAWRRGVAEWPEGEVDAACCAECGCCAKAAECCAKTAGAAAGA